MIPSGFCLSILLYWAFSLIWPPPGIGEGVRRHDENILVLPTAYRQDVPTQGIYSIAQVLEGQEVQTSEKGRDTAVKRGADDHISELQAALIEKEQ